MSSILGAKQPSKKKVQTPVKTRGHLGSRYIYILYIYISEIAFLCQLPSPQFLLLPPPRYSLDTPGYPGCWIVANEVLEGHILVVRRIPPHPGVFGGGI